MMAMCFFSLAKAKKAKRINMARSPRQKMTTKGRNEAMRESVESGREPLLSFDIAAWGLMSRGCFQRSHAATPSSRKMIVMPAIGQEWTIFILFFKNARC